MLGHDHAAVEFYWRPRTGAGAPARILCTGYPCGFEFSGTAHGPVWSLLAPAELLTPRIGQAREAELSTSPVRSLLAPYVEFTGATRDYPVEFAGRLK